MIQYMVDWIKYNSRFDNSKNTQRTEKGREKRSGSVLGKSIVISTGHLTIDTENSVKSVDNSGNIT